MKKNKLLKIIIIILLIIILKKIQKKVEFQVLIFIKIKLLKKKI